MGKQWYDICEMITAYDQRMVFSGECSSEFAAGVARAANDLTGHRIIVTKGRVNGRFVAELPSTPEGGAS